MKDINHQAPVKCSMKIIISASGKKVWEVLTDINKWPDWQTDIKTAKLNGALKEGTSFDWKTGGAKIHSSLHTVNPYLQFGWTGKTFGMSAIHNWTLTEEDGKTVVEVKESLSGIAASLFKKLFNKNLETGMQHWLELLKTACERKP